jgi:hypothetical protein
MVTTVAFPILITADLLPGVSGAKSACIVHVPPAGTDAPDVQVSPPIATTEKSAVVAPSMLKLRAPAAVPVFLTVNGAKVLAVSGSVSNAIVAGVAENTGPQVPLPLQTPSVQLSPCVQTLPSSQLDPLDFTGLEQRPVLGAQVPTA